MSYLKKKAHCSPFLKVYFVFERLIHRQNDFSLIPKRPKRCRKHFQERWDQPERSTINGSQVIA